MSHFTKVATQMVSRPHLVKALADLGLDAVEVYDEPQPLRGWEGQRALANVIVRKASLRGATADLGFARDESGQYVAIIEGMDRRKLDNAWLGRLGQRYAYRVAVDLLAEQSFQAVEEERDRDGTIRLTLRRMG
jgi:hypothetical protein